MLRRYGREQRWHPLAMLATYAITGYALWAIFQNPAPWAVLVWLAGAIVVHDFVFLPAYVGLYRLGARVTGAGPEPERRRRTILLQHIAVPAMVAGLALLVALPSVLRLSQGNYGPTTGLSQDPYLGRYLGLVLGLAVVSAVLYVVRVRREPPPGDDA